MNVQYDFGLNDPIIEESNQKMIQKIQTSIKDGTKANLFIGRSLKKSDHQLPVEKDRLWVSLDIDTSDIEVLDRIHLFMDCNNANHMAKIQGLFTKVIVDQSTWKVFNPGIFDRLVPLLKQGTESSLTFESFFQTVNPEDIESWDFNHIALSYPKKDDKEFEEKKINCFNDFCDEIGGQDKLASCVNYKNFKKQFEKENDDLKVDSEEFNLELGHAFRDLIAKEKEISHPMKKYFELARLKTKTFLEDNLFEKVELNLNAPFPYPTRYNWQKCDYFVATGLKKKSQI